MLASTYLSYKKRIIKKEQFSYLLSKTSTIKIMDIVPSLLLKNKKHLNKEYIFCSSSENSIFQIKKHMSVSGNVVYGFWDNIHFLSEKKDSIFVLNGVALEITSIDGCVPYKPNKIRVIVKNKILPKEIAGTDNVNGCHPITHGDTNTVNYLYHNYISSYQLDLFMHVALKEYLPLQDFILQYNYPFIKRDIFSMKDFYRWDYNVSFFDYINTVSSNTRETKTRTISSIRDFISGNKSCFTGSGTTPIFLDNLETFLNYAFDYFNG